MPTASRLIAAICLAALAFLVSEMAKPLFDEDKQFGNFSVINLVIGLIVGWQVIGSRAGRGTAAGINNGLTGGLVLYFWVLFLHSGYKMFQVSMRGRYDGAFDAAGAVFEIMYENALITASALVITTLIVGAALTGLVAEFVAKRAS
ncbi:TrgA family protein [Planktotalea sp.]|uniref:TrgA family protein n=1 Tax=Planktotalea sp. TaxID=2029877 RepID=UPI0032976442